MTLGDGIETNSGRLILINGLSLEEAVQQRDEFTRSFDLFISRAVIEEIYDPCAVFTAADRVLRSGGYMLHKIDLSDYGMFRDSGMHPLTFLTIPEGVYRLMASDSGIPNRKRLGYYREQMATLGYKARFFVTSLIGQGPLQPHKESIALNVDYSESTIDLVDQIRPKLCHNYRSLPDEELIVDGIFLVAQKSSGVR
jgi:hypothetical protein